jgi:hypothetical protein
VITPCPGLFDFWVASYYFCILVHGCDRWIIVCFAYGKRSVRQSGLIFDIAGFFFLDAGVAVWTSGRLMIDTYLYVASSALRL